MDKCGYVRKHFKKLLNLPNSETEFIYFQGINVASDFNIVLLYCEYNSIKNRYVLKYWGGNILRFDSKFEKKIISKIIAKDLQKAFKIAMEKKNIKTKNIGVLDGWTYYFFEKEKKYFGSVHSPEDCTLYGKLIILIEELIMSIFIKKEKDNKNIIKKIRILYKEYLDN